MNLKEVKHYSNIGRQIKNIALWMRSIALVPSIIFIGIGVICLSSGHSDINIIISVIMFCSAFLSFFSSLLLSKFIYAKGELVEKTTQIEINTRALVEYFLVAEDGYEKYRQKKNSDNPFGTQN